nr:ABC transporter ATP-binding protein [Bacteroidota bacterium]
MNAFSSIKEEDGKLIAYPNAPMDASTLNKTLFEKGIMLSHLEKRKESLEELFLEITKNN